MSGFRAFEPGRNPRSRRRPVRGFAPWEPGLGAVDAAGNVMADETGMNVSAFPMPTTTAKLPYYRGDGTRYAGALHDQIFGAKKGDPVTGAPGDVYQADQLGTFDLYTNPAMYGVQLNDEGKLFLAAVDAGIVPKTPAGLETLLHSIGGGYTALVARTGQAGKDFWTWYGQYLDWLRRAPDDTRLDPFVNPVTGVTLYRGTRPGDYKSIVTDANGRTTIVFASGASTSFGGSTVAAPTDTGKVNIQAVFDDRSSAPAGPPWAVYAFKMDRILSDGSVKRDTWNPRAEYADDASYQQLFADALRQGSTLRTKKFSQLDSAERAAIAADLVAYGQTPEYLDAATRTPPPISYVPGAKVVVGPQGSGVETTIQLPGAAPIPLSQYTGPNYNPSGQASIPSGRAPIPVGVPPVELMDGTLVAPPTLAVTNGAFGADDVTQTDMAGGIRTPVAAAGFGGWIAILALLGIGLTMKGGRR